ncbi:hypothetical protein [Marilutibacter chinensis]|uniref:WXG100 family type VII secretion target n=1 Tax=Marilutibacter chinensis TaxID=2912247 RepID=A0ABS9HPY4_9GAMM|nr:hypothetical protein [Lysobacter chinensis]MCF7220353.1 hypothetical protein [Lysobacter chinensis]
MDVLRTYSVERRDEAVARARQATASIDVQIQRLQARIDADWSGMNDDARRRSRSALREIERGRNAAAEWYGGMRHGSSAAWKEVREGFVRSYDELARALRHAREELRDGGRPRPEDDPSSQDAGQKEGS